MKRILSQDFYARSALEVAPELIGCELVYRAVDGSERKGVIVETEAYLQDDPASHSFRGCTPRNAAMFGPAGFSYVYLIYGMYCCLNVVTGDVGVGEAVLIRAVDFSGTGEHVSVASGPGKLCRYLGLDRTHSGLSYFDRRSSLQIFKHSHVSPTIVQTQRIGISKGLEKRWRWCWQGNASLSR
jgi:DNA-3-methyladenine glycosylase